MADRDQQFIASNSPQDLGEPDPGIAEADRDATGWDLRSMEDVQGQRGRGTPDDLGEDQDQDPALTIHGSGGPATGTRLPDDLMTGREVDETGEPTASQE